MNALLRAQEDFSSREGSKQQQSVRTGINQYLFPHLEDLFTVVFLKFYSQLKAQCCGLSILFQVYSDDDFQWFDV